MEIDVGGFDIVWRALVRPGVLAVGGLPDGDHGDDGQLGVLLLHRQVGRLAVQKAVAIAIPKHHLVNKKNRAWLLPQT